MQVERNAGSKRLTRGRVLLIGGAFILGFVVLLVASIVLWEWSNSTYFCSSLCHDVHPEEPAAYMDSFHAEVKCVECHMGRVSTLKNIGLKVTHARHLPETILHQYGRPTRAESLRPVSETCERCHWPPAFYDNSVREIRHFMPDEANTEKRTFIVQRTGGGHGSAHDGEGIHWHVGAKVEFLALDEKRQKIPWVRVTYKDGWVVEYVDVANPIRPENAPGGEVRVMDCVDCHNQAGHPFLSPEELVDRALAEGRLSARLPYVKAELMALLNQPYSSQEEARQAVAALQKRYIQDHPEVAPLYPEDVEQAAKLAEELVTRLYFAKPGLSWRDFPDNSGHGQHKPFPGCFRCHDGKHTSADGKTIRLQCNLCHTIPKTFGAGQPAVGPLDIMPELEPANHLDSNFIRDHRFLASDACGECHGEIRFGKDDSNFCANSACHGRAWPEVDLDAGFTHPVELVGKHAEIWCYQCHQGREKMEYVCSECHQPNVQPHYGDRCDKCHSPIGWRESAESFLKGVPVVSHKVETYQDCLACHDPAGKLVPAPAGHAGLTNEQCLRCHRVSG